MSDQGLTYSAAGVDIDAAQNSLQSVGDAITATHNENVLGGIGSFGCLYDGSLAEYDRPILVSSIDGVGTKTKIAQMTGDYSGIGHDIVNHCINDILCQGAKPLFFLDYFGCSKLDPAEFENVVRGAAEACQLAGCALVGGETAEMPGVYEFGEIDVVGSIVGVVEGSKRLPGVGMKAGDRLIGLASNGLHTNGYSLARRVLFEHAQLSVSDPLPIDNETTVGEALLKPHTNYFNAVYPLLQESVAIKAIAHITGGGLYDNLPRVLPSDLQAKIVQRSWEPLPIFRAIQELGQVPEDDLYRTFNMGIGMVLVVDQDDADIITEAINANGIAAAEIGKLHSGNREVTFV